MESQTAEVLTQKKCVPCEGGIPAYTERDSVAQLAALPQWRLTHKGQRIRRDWIAKDFQAALKFFDAVAQVAESEGHHPDLHLESYRQVWIEIWTHAIGGLSENDFILAAKIDRIPIDEKK